MWARLAQLTRLAFMAASTTLLITMATSIKIYLFGPFQIFNNNRLISNNEWRSQQTRAICKYLLTSRGQVVSSDRIIEEFWPKEKMEVARRRLHVRISQLRNALGSGKTLLQTVDGGYYFSLDDRCWVDVDEFHAV